MPSVHDGIGTWYYGKKNIQKYVGICPQCQSVAELTNYDTRLYIVVLMIPIIPLGRKHIIEQCSRCTRHHAIKYSAWEAYRAQLNEILAKFRHRPTDAASAREVLDLCVPMRDAEQFFAVAPEMENHLGHHPETLRLLAEAYDIFGRIDDTQRLLMASLVLQDDLNTRAALAHALLRRGKAEAAEEFVASIMASSHAARVPLALEAAQQYQVDGNHERALYYFDEAEKMNADLAKDPVFTKLRETSRTKLGTHEKVIPADIERKIKRAKTNRRLGLFGGIAAALAITVYSAVCFYMGMTQKVFLVSGLATPYQVKVQGQDYTIQPNEPKEIRVSQGAITVNMPPAPFWDGEVTYTIATPFFLRPFNQTAFVINPDGAAIIQKVRFYYAIAGKTAPDPTIEYVAGQRWYVIDSVDYPFSDPPDQLKMKESKPVESRISVQQFPMNEKYAPSLILEHMQTKFGEDRALDVAIAHVLADDHADAYLKYIEKQKVDKLIQKLQSHLDRYPAVIPLHRLYQNLQENRGNICKDEYEKRLTAHPNDKALMYLYARTLTTDEGKTDLFQRAAQGPDGCAYANFAIAYNHLSRGEFDTCLEMSRQAHQKLRNRETEALYIKALKATSHFDELATLAREIQKKPWPDYVAGYEWEACALALRNQDIQPVERTIETRLKLAKMPAETLETLLKRIRGRAAYIRGDGKTWTRSIQDDDSDNLTIQLIRGQTGGLESKEVKYPHVLALGYLIDYSQGDRSHAEMLFKRLANWPNPESLPAHWKRWLNGTETPTPEQLRADIHTVEQKLTYLVIMGIRQPALRQDCFALARQLNFNREFPYLLIQDAMKKAESQ